MVDGEVISERTVTVGQSAQVKGPIRGQVISVGGTIRGEIDASEKLELLETGKVFGSIRTKDLVVHSGAVLVGQVTMGSDETEESSSTVTEKETEETDHESVAVEVRTEKDRQDKEETDDEDKSEVELTPDEE
jgi:cytoskeletal protein CcmA (bactofilin family)